MCVCVLFLFVYFYSVLFNFMKASRFSGGVDLKSFIRGLMTGINSLLRPWLNYNVVAFLRSAVCV